MSLNLYAGSLQKFYSGNYERPMERYAHENNLKYQLVHPTPTSPSLSETEIQKYIEETKSFLAEKAPFTSNWDDKIETYYTEQLTYEAHSALYYAAAMAGLNRPVKPSNRSEFETFSLDSIGLSKQQKADSPAIIFEADIIYPGGDPNMAIFISESGEQLIVANLDWLYATLLQLEGIIWPGVVDISGWLKRGTITENDTSDIGQLVMHNAQFAFAAYHTTLDFALKNNVPLLLDM